LGPGFKSYGPAYGFPVNPLPVPSNRGGAELS